MYSSFLCLAGRRSYSEDRVSRVPQGTTTRRRPRRSSSPPASHRRRQRDAGDVRRHVAREEESGLRHVLALAVARERHGDRELLLEALVREVLLRHRRPDHAGAERVDANPCRRQIAGEALRQAHDPVLRSRVRRAMREPDQPSDRRQIDDRAAAALAHPASRRLAAVERAAEVDRDHVLPLLRRHRVDVADLAHAGAVDEDVDPARRRGHVLDRLLDGDGGADVHLTEQRLPRS